jgi:hypothetical protein
MSERPSPFTAPSPVFFSLRASAPRLRKLNIAAEIVRIENGFDVLQMTSHSRDLRHVAPAIANRTTAVLSSRGT